MVKRIKEIKKSTGIENPYVNVIDTNVNIWAYRRLNG